MSVITKDLGIASAYGYAKSKGYTGTEEEFAELMASYADVAQQAEAAAQDAEDAKDEAVTAKTDAQTAKTAAQAAQSAAETASGTASAKASEAAQSAQSAAGSASAAQTSATAASGSAQTAQTAAQTATNKASEASSSASAASTAKTGAETARTGAQTAQTAAETAQANAEAAASSVSASAAQIEQNTEDITGLKNDFNQFPNGTYPNMSVGNADQLTATVGIEDTAPYLFRTSGGSNDIGDREEVKKIVGGTVAWNQLIQNGDFSDGTANWGTNAVSLSVSNNVLTITKTVNETAARVEQTLQEILSGHKYLLSIDMKMGISGTSNILLADDWTNGLARVSNQANVWGAHKFILSPTTISTQYLRIYMIGTTEVGGTAEIRNVQITDLTQDFGTAIADYVYTLELATAGTGVAWLKKNFPAQFNAGYQAYDAGSLQSVSGLTEHKMVGFNQWDEEWELGIYNINTGEKQDNSTNIRNKNLIRILPNTQYCWNNTVSDVIRFVFYDADKNYLSYRSDIHSSPYVFTTPAKACYMAFYYGATSYSGTLCINLHWDGERDGEYEPYVEYTYPLDDSLTLRGIPKLDSGNNLYYDGDVYEADGTVTRRYGVFVLDGNTAIDAGSFYGMQFRFTLTGFKVPSVSTVFGDVLADGLTLVKQSDTWGAAFTTSAVNNANFIYFKLSDDITTLEGAKTYLNAHPITFVYLLATPTTETALPYQETQIVDDFGTEEFVLADGAFPVPVGHSTMYQNNLRAKLEMSPDSPDGDGLYVVQQESGENTYVPLASTATIQDILTRLTALENA